MAKIHKFVLANSLLDSPMAIWLTLTGTLSNVAWSRGTKGRCRLCQNMYCTKFVVEGMAGRRTSGRTLCLPTTRLLKVAPREVHDQVEWRDIGWRTVDKAVSEKLLFKSRKKNINYQIQECALNCQRSLKTSSNKIDKQAWSGV